MTHSSAIVGTSPLAADRARKVRDRRLRCARYGWRLRWPSGRSIVFQMAEVMVPRDLLQKILGAIAALRPLPPPAVEVQRRTRLPAGETRPNADLRNAVSYQAASRRSNGCPIVAPHLKQG
jgi:hypothetical protein